MAWENIEVKSVVEVKDIRLDLGAAKADMADRMEEIKKTIRMSDTYERWADNLENGLDEIIQVFFNVINVADSTAGVLIFRPISAAMMLGGEDAGRKKLLEAEKACEKIVKDECDSLEICFCPHDANTLKILVQNKSVFKMFTDAICWISDEAYDKTKRMNISSERLWGIICKKIGYNALEVWRGRRGGRLCEVKYSAIDRVIKNLDDSISEHSIRTFLLRQEAWGKMKGQNLIR